MFDPQRPDYDNTPASTRRPPFSYAAARPNAAPHVTIVTPFYNERSIFHETARSILKQSLQQWEWLIVNDASTDPEALQVLDSYRNVDPRIRVIDQKRNQGPSAARNAAFRCAAAEHVALLDSDNLIEPTALEKWLWFLTSHTECAFVKGQTIGFGAQTYLWTEGFHSGSKFLDSNQVDTTSLIRRDVHHAVGGFDEAIRDGFEDWEFWLRCANAGFWGHTMPEPLDWYRRRASHSDRWKSWDNGGRQRAFGMAMRERYPKLAHGGFPRIASREHIPNETLPEELPCENLLSKERRRVLMIVPWLSMGGADKFQLDLLAQLTGHGWEVTLATTLNGPDPWEPAFSALTPDVFVLHRFLRLVDYPRFLRYLIQSRQVDTVLISHSEFGYQLLPYLRAHFPDVAFVDYCHIEEQWKNGGYPRMGVEYQEQLDLNVVSSEHLKRWMVSRGADAERIQVCYTGVDADRWRPDSAVRARVRRELNVDERTNVILFAARVCAQKQPRVLADTLLRLHRAGVRCVMLVAGDGPDLEWLRHFVGNHRLNDNVRLLGAVSNARVNELMKASDLFFLPSEWEGIALSIYEAMAAGLAVVGADVGGQRELVTGDCGVVIARRRPEEEVETYVRILSELIADPARARAMGAAGRARVTAAFRLDQMGDTMVEQFDRAHTLRTERRRPQPGLGLARALAAQAVEYVRIVGVCDDLWAKRGLLATLTKRSGLDWRQRIYALCRTLYEPLYRRGAARGGAWYFGIAERLKIALLDARR